MFSFSDFLHRMTFKEVLIYYWIGLLVTLDISSSLTHKTYKMTENIIAQLDSLPENIVRITKVKISIIAFQ